jgi:hypothetical protein
MNYEESERCRSAIINTINAHRIVTIAATTSGNDIAV